MSASPRRRAARRLLGLLFVGALPWTIIRWTNPDGSIGYGTYFTYGLGTLFGPVGKQFALLPVYLARVAVVGPYWHQLWPTGAFLFACALVSAAFGLVGREDRRVTAGLLVMAGGASFLHAAGLAIYNDRLAVLPLGPLLVWNAAVLGYREDLWRLALLQP